MSDPSAIPLLVAFCAALAAAGVYYINVRRLRHERARPRVVAVRHGDDAHVVVTVANVGARPALDLELSADPLAPGIGLEGLAASGQRELDLGSIDLPAWLTISFDDLHDGRVSERRLLQYDGGAFLLGKIKGTRVIASSDAKEQSAVMAPQAAAAIGSSVA